MTTAKERIEQILYHYALNPRELAMELGYERPQIFYDICSGKTQKISKTLAQRLMANFSELNPEWVRRGEGPMLEPDEDDDRPTHTIRYYPEVDATAGDVQFLENPDEHFVPINIPFLSDCQYAINVHGSSMYPSIKDGDVVLLAEWNERFIDWGKPYLIVTRSGYRCIKYLLPSRREGCVTCRSEDRDNNPDFDIETEDIVRIYAVKGLIARKFT